MLRRQSVAGDEMEKLRPELQELLKSALYLSETRTEDAFSGALEYESPVTVSCATWQLERRPEKTSCATSCPFTTSLPPPGCQQHSSKWEAFPLKTSVLRMKSSTSLLRYLVMKTSLDYVALGRPVRFNTRLLPSPVVSEVAGTDWLCA
eukprot:scaffold3735_cov153-Pinguiococcus_pyrenoidosus.AAC.2